MYRRLALIFALLILGLACWSRLSSAEDSHMTELEHLNQIWEQAWLDKDAVLVEKLMADEYVYIAPNGKIMDRDSILKIIRSPSYHLDYGTRTEVVVKAVSQDTAVVIHRAQDGGSLEGKTFKDDNRCTMLCVRRGHEWRVVLEQCSPNNQ